MKRICSLYLAVCLALAAHHGAQAQSGKLLEVMKEVQSNYARHPLSFDVVYTCSNESTPEVVLDSMQGTLEMSGRDSRYILGNTETIRNSRYTIILFKEDKIMYLARPDTATMMGDPMMMVQSALEKAGITESNVLQRGANKIIEARFRTGSACKQIEMTVDTLSGRLLNMRYVVKMTMLIDADVEDDAASGYDEYALVLARFNHYREIPADPNRFHERTFFYREGDEFKVTPAYQDYKIFIGSPNLK